MTWTEAADTAATYAPPAGGTIWDDGDTLWDVFGNVARTRWDLPSTAWASAAPATSAWSDA